MSTFGSTPLLRELAPEDALSFGAACRSARRTLEEDVAASAFALTRLWEARAMACSTGATCFPQEIMRPRKHWLKSVVPRVAGTTCHRGRGAVAAHCIYIGSCSARGCAGTSETGSRRTSAATSTGLRSGRPSRGSAHVNGTCTRQALISSVAHVAGRPQRGGGEGRASLEQGVLMFLAELREGG